MFRRMSIPAVLSAVLAVVYISVRSLNPAWMDQQTRIFILAALTAAVGITILRLVNFILLDLVFLKRKGREAPQLLRMVVSIIGYSAIFIAIYSGVFDKSLSGVLATSAVLTVILGLALQDTLGNFFAGISLHIEQPYQIGDALHVAEVVGKVESVTWRTTAVRTNNNSLVVLPNSKIARDPIEVYSLNALNRRVLRFPAPSSVRPETIIRIAGQVAASTPKVSVEKTPVVRVAEFSDSNITYEILYWLADYMWAHEIEAVMRERLWYSFGRAGIEIPFPTRHVLLENRQGAEVESGPDFESVLAGVDILKPLSPRELAEVAGSARSYSFAPGETILRTGDTGDSMFVIYRGQAEVLTAEAAGSPRQVAVLKPGDIIGEMGLFTGETRSADVRAVGELELLEIRKATIHSLLTENRVLAEAFSLIIGGRQAQLDRLSQQPTGEEKVAAGETILQRILRFFSLT